MAKRIPLDRRQKIAEEYEAGATLRDLARKYNLAVSTIQRIADEFEVMRDRSGIHLKQPRLTFMTIEKLEAAILKLLPSATFGQDDEGQVVIYTGLKTVKVEALIPFEE